MKRWAGERVSDTWLEEREKERVGSEVGLVALIEIAERLSINVLR